MREGHDHRELLAEIERTVVERDEAKRRIAAALEQLALELQFGRIAVRAHDSIHSALTGAATQESGKKT